jgi:hypothetical protein
MTRNLSTTPSDESVSTRQTGELHATGVLRSAIEGFGALYAALAGLALGGFENFADRRAETQGKRLRQRAATVRRRALRREERRKPLA